MHSLQSHIDPLGLKELHGKYNDDDELKRLFGDFVLFVLDRHLPRNFNRSIFKQWEESLSALRGGAGQSAAMTITSEEYREGSLGDLSSIVSRLDGAEIDGLKIGVRSDNGEIVIEIAKLDKTAQGADGVIAHTGESARALVV